MKRLETERLILRNIELKDTQNVFNTILSNKDTLYFLDWPFCENMKEAERFVNKLIENSNKLKHYCWVIEEKNNDNFVGCILLCNVDEEKRMAEIEYVANSEYRGKGYIPEANIKVIEYLIKECNFFRIEAVCNIENVASSRVMEKSGMRFEGILRGRALNLNAEGNPGDLKMYSIIPVDLE